eukprot:TRINITY_DN44167_c0_g1_i1.p1 TRINITY_DN44167_c0_g1~~TRINITY_DN44167_c0_g1_i1.p1  ORF type:complete len:167 (+),score=30.02 TRINITY_DN44167_c0_g1_i1:11-511(+)
MPGKPDFSALVILKTKVFGGESGPAQALGSKLGPLGVNARNVNADIIKEGKAWAGVRIGVELHCQNRAAKVVLKPGVSATIIKAMCDPRRDRKKEKLENRSGNISFDEVEKIARWMEEEGKSMSKSLEGSVLQVLGSCLSIGCTVDGLSAKEVTRQIKSGERTVSQ